MSNVLKSLMRKADFFFLLRQCFSSDVKSTQFNLGKRNKRYILLYNQISVIILSIECIVKE